MKIIKVGLFLSYVSITLFSSLYAEKICNPGDSIERQKERYISQGLLVTIMQEKMLFAWPVKVCECWISSLYGERKGGFHNGVDLAASKGTHVFAAADGFIEVIKKSDDVKSYGNMILMNHDDSAYKTRYAHLDSIEKHIEHRFNEGKEVFVKKGQKIGEVGATGHVVAKSSKSDPSHLHFEIYKGNKRIDPLKYLFASDVILLKNKNLRK